MNSEERTAQALKILEQKKDDVLRRLREVYDIHMAVEDPTSPDEVIIINFSNVIRNIEALVAGSFLSESKKDELESAKRFRINHGRLYGGIFKIRMDLHLELIAVLEYIEMINRGKNSDAILLEMLSK